MFFKLPRLYSDKRLTIQEPVSLDQDQTHYIKNVMRRRTGDQLRLFDGENGEFLAEIAELDKKNTTLNLKEKIREQSPQTYQTHLFFTPLAKNRMDMIIEKSVELGVTDFHPIITNRTEHRKIKADRITAQIIEAAEQSERLSLPRLHEICPLSDLYNPQNTMPCAPILQWGCERDTTQRQPLGFCNDANQAFLIGPVGGFDEAEHDRMLSLKHIQPISLGKNILRAETACVLCISASLLKRIE